jgi:hypothetical protein
VIRLNTVYLVIFADHVECCFGDRLMANTVCKMFNANRLRPEGWSKDVGCWSVLEVPFGGGNFARFYRCTRCKELKSTCDGDHTKRICERCLAEASKPKLLRAVVNRLFPVNRHVCAICERLK